MNRRTQQIDVVAAAAAQAGAAVRFEQRVSGHISAEFTLNAGSPNDRNAYKNAQRAGERKLDELKDGQPKQEKIK